MKSKTARFGERLQFSKKFHFKEKLASFDFKSLRFKLWLYFVLFAICLMAALWLLQTILLQPYYRTVKERVVLRTAHSISAAYKISDFDAAELHEEIKLQADRNDMYIFLQSADGQLALRSDSDMPEYYPPGVGGLRADSQFQILYQKLEESPTGTIKLHLASPSGENDIIALGQLIKTENHSDAVLCIFTKLTPLDSTISILTSQLILVTIASLILACALSIWISRRVSNPISSITKKAGSLAAGQYDITFDGGHYSEIQELANTLTYTSAELAKTDTLQKDLIANVSHDLRTPLTMIRSYAEMIRDLSGDKPEKRNAHLQVIIDEADRLNLLVSDLLTLSKIQSGVETAEMSPFDLKACAASLLSTYKILEEQDGYQFLFQCSEETLSVVGDPRRLSQVIVNLLNNAVRHGRDNRTVTLALTRMPSNFVRVSVSDRGPGIPPEELEHIWDRYYKASGTGTRDSSGGTGLGLSIVKEILVQHNARFGVESQLGEGSCFWFELPLYTPAGPQKDQKPAE